MGTFYNQVEPISKLGTDFYKVEQGFSFLDHTAVFKGATSDPYVLGELATISRSVHRDVYRVLGLGRCYPFGVTRSSHMIGGTLEFRTVHEEAFMHAVRETMRKTKSWSYPTEVPPFDIVSTLVNDEGDTAIGAILGVVIVDAGHVMGIDIPMVQETYMYMAQKIIPIQLISKNGKSLLSAKTLSDNSTQFTRQDPFPTGIAYN